MHIPFTIDQPALPPYDPADPSSRATQYGRPVDAAGQVVPLFDGPVRREQVAQGRIGDCGLVATIGAVAGHRPQVITAAITQNPDGSFMVMLHEVEQDPGRAVFRPTGRVYLITVTPEVPVQIANAGAEHGVQQVAVGSSWASILEKVLAGLDSQWTADRWAGEPSARGYERLDRGAWPLALVEAMSQLRARR